jgi:cytochrome c5
MQKNKLFVIGAMVVAVALLSQSFQNPQQPPKKLKNIKAFPASMSYKEVDHEMDKFKVALGVKCNYCHAQTKESAPKLDMANDDNPKKEIARSMIKMTIEMNEKYMSTIAHADTATIQQVTCNTCHRGQAKPTVEPIVVK